MSINNTRVALVTGSSSGIGRATALALHAAGFTTYATARRRESISDLGRLGLHTLTLDVTNEASMTAAVRLIEQAHGAIDVLVNNAGYGEMGPIEEVSVERVRRQFETNVFGLLRLSQLALPGMRRKGWGRVINISSMGGEFTFPLAGVYHASKYAVESLSDALRFEVAPFGVEVVVVQPGPVRTPLAAATLEQIRTAPDSPYAEQVAAFRRLSEASAGNDGAFLTPEEVAAVVVEAAGELRPEPRYRVGDPMLIELRHKTPDRAWDTIFRQQFGLAEPYADRTT